MSALAPLASAAPSASSIIDPVELTLAGTMALALRRRNRQPTAHV